MQAPGHVQFFPINEGAQSVSEALSYCHGCPVLATCLAWACERGEEGVWGGTTTMQRRALRRATLTHPAPALGDACGSEAGYSRHRRAGTDPCPGCRAAHNRLRADAKKLRRNELKLRSKGMVLT